METNVVTITTAMGSEITGIPNVYLNEHTKEAEVFLNDTLLVTYSGCNDRNDAVEMMLKDYGIPE